MYVPDLQPNNPCFGNAVSRAIGRLILSSMGWRFEGRLPDLKKFVAIGAPHTSNWDFVIGMSALMALGIRVNWIGKDSIFKWPVKYIWQWLGGKPVDRFHPHGVVQQTVDLIKSHEHFVLGLSPEGTRKDMTQWRTGFYHMAHGAEVPLLFVYFDYKNKALGFGPLFFTTGELEKDLPQMLKYYKAFSGKFRKSWQETA